MMIIIMQLDEENVKIRSRVGLGATNLPIYLPIYLPTYLCEIANT